MEGIVQDCAGETNLPMFRVIVNKIDHTYTLIQENITLTEEQAMQIYSAYKEEINKLE